MQNSEELQPNYRKEPCVIFTECRVEYSGDTTADVSKTASALISCDESLSDPGSI